MGCWGAIHQRQVVPVEVLPVVLNRQIKVWEVVDTMMVSATLG